MTPEDRQHVLLIGDDDRQVRAALSAAAPLTRVTCASSWFDAIAELGNDRFGAILAPVEPIERRAETAVGVLRRLAGDSRIVLLTPPALEPLSRRLLAAGCDDYLIAPASPRELHAVLAVASQVPGRVSSPGETAMEPVAATLLASISLAESMLEYIVRRPGHALVEAVRALNEHLAPLMRLELQPAAAPPPQTPDGTVALCQPLRSGATPSAQLCLVMPRDQDENAARHLLSRLATMLAKAMELEQRERQLQRLAITDELTGLYNARYFRHFLSRIIDLARVRRFPVALFLFDIDDLKKYNDQFGHAAGDEVLRQTAILMRRCCREHDLVARIGGDEFAVVFWDKEGPRQPRDPKAAGHGRLPQTALDILNRFRKQLATQEFAGLGPHGRGVLTISGGLAVYPYDARTVEELIDVADRELVFRAKKSGKDTIVLVGGDERGAGPGAPR